METRALIERGKDGTFGVYTPDISSTIIGEGNTVEEAKADFENSVREVIQLYKDEGKELPDELKDVQFVYKYDVASMFSYYDWINVSRFAKKAGINSSLMRQYRMGRTYISEHQKGKIQSTLNAFGKELAAINL